MNTTRQFPKFYPTLIITLCASFLFYKYILQIYPSIITEQLMREFKLTGAGLGNLAATFYYAYMLTQLFVGVMLDKYSARWLTAGAIFCCALGLFFFSQTYSLLGAQLSRALMGVGVAFATVAYMKLAANWFSPQRYAVVGGLLATAAMTGAVFGQAPLAYFVHLAGWRESLYIISLAGFGLAFLFILLVRDAPHITHLQHAPICWQDVLQIFKNKQNWLLTLYGGLACSPIAVFGGLWGNPFIEQAYHLSKTQAATMTSLVFVGLGVGSPLMGLLSNWLRSRLPLMFISTFISAIAISLVLYCHPMPLWALGALLFTFGFMLGAFVLVFTIGKELNSAHLTATVIAMINTSDAFLDALTEPAIGKLLDLNWDGTIVNGVHYFSLHSYHVGLSILPIYLVIATLLLLWVKKTR